jgi:hypothetical protein
LRFLPSRTGREQVLSPGVVFSPQAEFTMGPNGGCISGSGFLIDGGATANFFFGPKNREPAQSLAARGESADWNERQAAGGAFALVCSLPRIRKTALLRPRPGCGQTL